MAGKWFVGEHERQLDPKGRVALPVDFRARLEPFCYLTIGEAQCIDVLTAEDFDTDTEATLARLGRGEITRNEVRARGSNTVQVKVDGQGRINVPEKLRHYAGLAVDAAVLITGAFDRVEIWHPERFANVESAGTMAIAGTNT